MKTFILKKTAGTRIIEKKFINKLFPLSVFIFLLTLPVASQAQLIDFKWTSSDTSLVSVMLGPMATFKWKNADGSEVNLTGGTVGASFSMTDSKTKGGSVAVDPTSIVDIINPNHGKNGEPPKKITGQITEGTGSFQLSLKGFNEITDVNTTFTAALVSNGSDNPINLSVFGQGDQLAFNPPGTVDYISKWASSDSISLSNGQRMDIGNFFLLGGNQFLPDKSQASFEYSIQGSDPATLAFASTFTTGEKYVFTDASLNDSLFEISGSVSKQLKSVPEPAVPLLFLSGLVSILLARKQRLSRR